MLLLMSEKIDGRQDKYNEHAYAIAPKYTYNGRELYEEHVLEFFFFSNDW